MDTSLRKIYILILTIIILPSIIFVIYEIGSLRENEKVIEEIYGNQLDAILYSVNQYSEDVVSSWANRVNYEQNEAHDLQASLEKIFAEMPSVRTIVQFDSSYHEVSFISKETELITERNSIDSILAYNRAIIGRLYSYVERGYRKIESFDLQDGSQLIIFVTTYQRKPIINALVLDPFEFINSVLDPKIQEIAGDRFHISAFLALDDQLIYNSGKQDIPRNIEHRRTFWILDNYYLGIEMKDKTISDLAWERSRKDLIVIAIVEVILLAGVWIIYRNVKRQMELAQIKSDFVSNVSHEIRTPLALISMYIESLERGMVKTPEKIREYYTILLQEARRLTGIVNKILNFSQVESGKRSFTFQRFRLKEVVDDVVSTFKFNLEKQDFTWSVDGKDDIYILADKEAVTDVLVNLVDNAIKYSENTKKIDIRFGRENDDIFVEIRDHGIGIPKSERKHIFDKFYRVTDRNLAHKAKGSGVGLAIVRHIMDAHEGRITVQSKTGEGSAFRLFFPQMKTSMP